MKPIFLALVLSLAAWGEPEKGALGRLDRATRDCVKNLGPGAKGTPEALETCLQQAVENFYKPILTKAYGGYVARGCVQPVATPTPVPTDRSAERVRLKEEFKTILLQPKCQRCHTGMDPEGVTLQQAYQVLHTPSHKDRLGDRERQFLKALKAYFD